VSFSPLSAQLLHIAPDPRFVTWHLDDIDAGHCEPVMHACSCTSEITCASYVPQTVPWSRSVHSLFPRRFRSEVGTVMRAVTAFRHGLAHMPVGSLPDDILDSIFRLLL
jgi:hypothetical protein